jgi:hypothetical protein
MNKERKKAKEEMSQRPPSLESHQRKVRRDYKDENC